ncbi:MAG: hypothetical protein HN793_07415 [Rhodospirillaceae bacterium]|nr:hypothetical protein [Rhodospirillaceae bacterium]
MLRALDDGSVRSAIVRLHAGQASVAVDAAPATVQGFVLSGSIVLGEKALNEGGFFVVPTGAPLPSVATESGAELVVIFDDPKTAKASTAEPVVLVSAYDDVDPIVPVIDGVRLEGFARRVLWENPETGADTRLLTVPGGFEGKGPNWHPVHEEIFCLEGDIGPDDTRLMVPGTYLHNPAYGVHGYHEHSKGGATILEWHDGLWEINFTS